VLALLRRKKLNFLASYREYLYPEGHERAILHDRKRDRRVARTGDA
jgi:hypothetical protein